MIRHALAALALTAVPASAGEETAAPLSARPLSSRAPGEWFTAPPSRIDVGPPRQVRTERLDANNLPHLSQEEAELVRLYVEGAGVAPASAERLAAGEEAPDDVELRPFPTGLVARIPRLGGRAYVAAGDAIAIVDPETRRIGQVLKP